METNHNIGGPANTPPFSSEPDAVRTAADHQIPEHTGGASGFGGGSTGGAGFGTASGSAGTPSSGTAAGSSSTSAFGSDSGTGAAGATGGPGSGGTQTEQVRDQVKQAASKLEERVNDGMKQAAGHVETAAEQLGRIADERLGGGSGIKGRAGEVAHGTADTLNSVAGYLRDNDFENLRRDLERQMRERPLQTLLIGVAAGWVVGKILR